MPGFKFTLQITCLLILILFSTGCLDKSSQLDLSIYDFRDTRSLVKFVHDAYLILEKDGISSLQYFHDNREKFKTENQYLYIYNIDGTNLFHAGMDYMEGINIRQVVDRDGKYILDMIINALEDKNNPHSWVHFSWFEPGKFNPVPKSSCHFKVTTKEGIELFVGGGLDYPQEEKEFIRIAVDNAADLIEQKGRSAFPEISDPVSIYNYRDVRVFAFGPYGKIHISPVLMDSTLQIQILEFKDEVGHKPFQRALANLEKNDATWEIFMDKTRYQRLPTKKCLYLRKIKLAEDIIYIGAVTDLPKPPWTG